MIKGQQSAKISGTANISLDFNAIVGNSQSAIIWATLSNGGPVGGVAQSAMFTFHKSTNGTVSIRTVLASNAPGNNDGNIAFSGNTLSILNGSNNSTGMISYEVYTQ